MSFGESVFSAGFIQKTVKVDLDVRLNRVYPQRNGHQKTLEDSRGLCAKVPSLFCTSIFLYARYNCYDNISIHLIHVLCYNIHRLL